MHDLRPAPTDHEEDPTMSATADRAAPTAAAPGAGWEDVGAITDVPLLEGRRATVAGRRVAVFRLPGRFAVTDAACPHRGGPLSDGLLADGCVTCPLHNWRVDLATGRVVGQDARVALHEVQVVEGRLWVRLADASPAGGDGTAATSETRDPCDGDGCGPAASVPSAGTATT